jgi:type IV secretion system protein VirB10
MSNETEEQNSVPGERGTSSVAKRRHRNDSPLMKGGAVAAICIVSAGFLWLSWGSPKKEERALNTVARQTAGFEPAPPLPPPPAAVPVQFTALPPTGTPAREPPEEDEEEDKLMRSSRRAPVLAWNKGGQRQQGIPAVPPAAAGDPINLSGYPPGSPPPYGYPPGQRTPDPERHELQSKLQPTRVEGVRAGHLGNRDFVIAMGTPIPCVLETAMASDQPGYVSCVVTRDILSDNGRVVLLDRGTQVVGEYRGGLKRGQKRMFVLWTRAKTPTGVIVALASPGTDALGRAGFDGAIDTHFWERFGSAILLSVVDDGMRLLTTELQRGDGNNQTNVFVPSGTLQGGKDAAAIAVQESINIPPTLNKNQGESVNIFVARDLDFSSVYGLRVTERRTDILDRTVPREISPPLVTKN